MLGFGREMTRLRQRDREMPVPASDSWLHDVSVAWACALVSPEIHHARARARARAAWLPAASVAGIRMAGVAAHD